MFVENRLRHLRAFAAGRIQATVMAPIPWFPSTNPRFGAWARNAAAPQAETRHGITVLHPRFVALPRVGMNIAPWLLYAAARRALPAGAPFDLIDAHYLYPDGVAAVWLGRRLGVPVVLTARGSDVTQLPDHRVPRALILRAAAAAAAVITVSRGLSDALTRLGVPAGRITVLRNGIDLAQFGPQDQSACRTALGVTGPAMVSVGALIPRKGHDVTIAALAHLPGWQLLIAGEGAWSAPPCLPWPHAWAWQTACACSAPCPTPNCAPIYGAADLSVLSSEREGWANVLLESMACGTPVVASPIAGNDEVVQSPPAGLIARARTPEAVAESVRALYAPPPRARRYKRLCRALRLG